LIPIRLPPQGHSGPSAAKPEDDGTTGVELGLLFLLAAMLTIG
jgi:hypothetical protein